MGVLYIYILKPNRHDLEHEGVRAHIGRVFKDLFGARSLVKISTARNRKQVKGVAVKNTTITLYDYNFEFLENARYVGTFRLSKDKCDQSVARYIYKKGDVEL